MNVLVTGAHGFLGSHITEHLLASGHGVRALVSPWGDPHNLGAVSAHPRLDIARADVRDPATLAGVAAGVEGVVHAAARVADWGTWDAFHRTNVLGTQHVLEAARAAGARRFVLISSLAVHRYRGFRDADPEALPRDRHDLPYARSKILAEDLVRDAGLEGVVVRPGLWPLGERDPVLRRVAHALSRGALPLVGGGDAVLNTVYAGNLALGVRLALERPEAPGRTYAVADDGAPTWLEVLTELAHAIGAAPPRLRLPAAPARLAAAAVEAGWRLLAPGREPPLTRYRASLMARDVHVSIARTRAELGYAPPVSWREGVRRGAAALPRVGGKVA